MVLVLAVLLLQLQRTSRYRNKSFREEKKKKDYFDTHFPTQKHKKEKLLEPLKTHTVSSLQTTDSNSKEKGVFGHQHVDCFIYCLNFITQVFFFFYREMITTVCTASQTCSHFTPLIILIF